MVKFSDLVTVLFQDGTFGRYELNLCGGGCMIGDPTAYVVRRGQTVLVKPGESVQFIEVQ
jgi:hypothetical protein